MSSIIFTDHKDFNPDYTPKQIFELGSFGGTYWRPIYSNVVGKEFKDVYKKYKCLKGIDKKLMTKKWDDYDTNINRYKVKVGMTLEFWESMGWVHAQDPYGWIQWYCEFYEGRRTPDDIRQIKRWRGVKNRFNLSNKTPAMKQTLQHWAIA